MEDEMTEKQYKQVFECLDKMHIIMDTPILDVTKTSSVRYWLVNALAQLDLSVENEPWRK